MKITFVLICILISFNSSAQSTESYWQQYLRYDIKAELNDKENSITGFETIVYKNNSPSTLEFIWFHIWPNAYKDDNTALMKQIKNDKDRSKKLKNIKRGSIDGLSFKINNQPALTSSHPEHTDIIKLNLNKPLLPGDSISISTPFKVMLPSYFSRSGFADGEFMACQWYPKPAVFDKNGWNEMPYLDMGEFYSDFGDYKVQITLPADYIVGATGVLQTTDELYRYKSVGAKNLSTTSANPALYIPASGEKKILVYHANNVHDFAWFADKNFVIQYDTIILNGGITIDALSYFHNKKSSPWKNSMSFIKDGLRKYSTWIGNYDYPVVQVVEGPKNNTSGGMEYPMITLITSPDAKPETLDAVITHEIGHNWFMGMLASNERMHTWMDEGMNSYFQFRYEAEKYRSNSIFGDAIPVDIKKLDIKEFQQSVYTVIEQNIPMHAAMDIPAEKFKGSEEYGLISYVKPALWMYMLEAAIGRDKVDHAFRYYFSLWKFKHPQPSDMEEAFEKALGVNLDKFFELTKKEGKME